MRVGFRKLFCSCLLLSTLSGCANLAYYAHLARGEHQLLSRREPITRIVADAARDPALRERLQKVLTARAFASAHLGLPDNASYTQYADLRRPYVVWNVFATGELSLEPVQHCFLLVGCLAYRGYFDEVDAQALATQLKTEGKDVHVSGVPAYSTLGWFDDPVINTMMHWRDETLIGTVFHELTHQKFYLKNDTAFSESLASFVEDEGLRQYLAVTTQPPLDHQRSQDRQRQFVELMLCARERLSAIYRRPLPAAELRELKQQEFARLLADYRQLRDERWGGFSGYDAWFDSGLNNAKLLPFGLYDHWVPAFAALFRQHQHNWSAFYLAVEQLGREPKDQREQRLRELAAQASQ